MNTPISKVEYYQGTTLIGSSTISPYSTSWTPTVAGTYSLTAKATDSAGAVTTSAAVSITVKTLVTQIYYLQGDHQGTPRIATDGANKVVWRNQPLGEPFGLSAVEEDPDGDGQTFVLNLRFPGQYYDKETATHYNMQRDYDPATGRYLQSDPIGLAGGINTYAYVGGNPLQFVDPWGLAKCPDVERGPNGEPLRARTTVGPDDLGAGTGTNASSRAYAKSMGNAGDDAGHILGRNLGGSGGKDNIFAQAPNINRGSFAKFEGRVAEFVRDNGSVDVDVTFKYAKGGTRPIKVIYDVFQNGQKLLSKSFLN